MTELRPRAIRLTDVAFGLEYRHWMLPMPYGKGPDPERPWGWQCRACSNGHPRWYATRESAEQAATDHEVRVIHQTREAERLRAWEIVTALLPILAALPAPTPAPSREHAGA